MSDPINGVGVHTVGDRRVVVTGVEIPFGEMVMLILKIVLASIPAYIILFIIFGIIGAIFGGIFSGMMGRMHY